MPPPAAPHNTHAHHRFSFKALQPGVFSQEWALFTHPPLAPAPHDAGRRGGEPLTLTLQGVAVAHDDDAAGPAAVAAHALEQHLNARARDIQVCEMRLGVCTPCVCLWQGHTVAR
jgi:hypothetical protein